MRNSLCQIVDNLLRICEPDGMKNPALMTETLELLKNYDFEFRGLLTVTDKQNNFIEGYEQFLFAQDKVGLKPNELDDAKLYVQQNMQAEVGLWTEADVAEKLKDWRLGQMSHTNLSSHNTIRIVDKIDLDSVSKVAEDSATSGSQMKVAMARSRVKDIKTLDEAKRLLNRITEMGIEDVLEVLIND